MKMHVFFCSALLLLIGFGGCSQQSAQLGHQIAGADRIVATNSGIRASLTVTGDEAKKIAASVASAKRDRKRYMAMFDWEIQFYSGTRFLAAVHMQDRLFLIDDKQFSDNTGVMKAFYDSRLREAVAQ